MRAAPPCSKSAKLAAIADRGWGLILLALTRSMLSTFGSSTAHFSYVMEGATGLGAFLIVLGLGISMLVSAARMRQE